jgi:hypothetical protein
MGESYVRAENARLKQFAPPVLSSAPANQRGAINEGAFLIFQEAMKLSEIPWSLSTTKIERLLNQAAHYVAGLSHGAVAAPATIPDTWAPEAILIADRLHRFFVMETCDVIVRPAFPGCGWVNNAEGDVLSGSTLYEVKAGQRHFRLADIRQILCYCALDFSSKRYGIKSISLINPRAGIVIREDLESLCNLLSGTGSGDVLGEIVAYISEPFSRYQAG